jgi:predicted MFS family arabinose efflux permease
MMATEGREGLTVSFMTHPSVRLFSAACADSVALGGLLFGSATGAAVGALVIADGGVRRLGWVAAGFSVAALLAVSAGGRPKPAANA